MRHETALNVYILVVKYHLKCHLLQSGSRFDEMYYIPYGILSQNVDWTIVGIRHEVSLLKKL